MYNHSPPTRHPHSSYALKPVLSAPTSIRPSQNKATEIIDTAAAPREPTIYKQLATSTQKDKQVCNPLTSCYLGD